MWLRETTHWHDLDVWKGFIRCFFEYGGNPSGVQEFGMGDDGQLQDGGEEEASPPDEVFEEFNEENPWPLLERQERIGHANIEADCHAEMVLLYTAIRLPPDFARC